MRVAVMGVFLAKIAEIAGDSVRRRNTVLGFALMQVGCVLFAGRKEPKDRGARRKAGCFCSLRSGVRVAVMGLLRCYVGGGDGDAEHQLRAR